MLNPKKIFIAVAVVALAAMGSTAAEKTIKSMKAGCMDIYLADAPDLTSLTIEGLIDVRDFDYISANQPLLETLDISNCSIEAYDGFRKLTASQHADADVLPALALSGTAIKSISLPTGLKGIGDGALAYTPLESIELPAGVATIGAGAFAGTRLTTVTIPAVVTLVGEGAFRGCTELAQVRWNTTDVPAATFEGCTALASFTPGSLGIYTMGDRAFAGCTSLTSVKLDSRLLAIGNEAFRGSGLTSANLSGCTSLASVGAWAWAGCTSLTSVTLPASLPSLGEAALFDASALNAFSGADGLEEIAPATFKGADQLDVCDYGPQASTFGPFAFYGMTSMTQANLPGTLMSIGSHAFDGCNALVLLQAPELQHVPELGEDVWGDLDRTKVSLKLARNMVDEFKAAPVWQDFIMNSSSIDDDGNLIENLTDDATRQLAITLEGRNIVVAASEPLASVEVYDVAGLTLHRSAPGANVEVVDASRFAARMVIVSATSQSGRRLTTKLAL